MKIVVLAIIMLLSLSNLAAYAQSYSHQAPPARDTGATSQD